VRGVEAGLFELGDIGVDAHDAHEVDGLVDLAGEFFILLPLGRVFDKGVVPGVDPLQRCVAAAGEGAQDVHGRAGEVIALQHPFRVRPPGFTGRLDAVDHVAPVAGELDAVYHFGVGGARLGVLAGHTADLDHRLAARVAHDHRHLEDDLEQLPDGRSGAHGKGFGAIASLEEKGLALGGHGQLFFQFAGLAGEHQGRELGNGPHRLVKGWLVRPVGLLQGLELLPARFVPLLCHGAFSKG